MRDYVLVSQEEVRVDHYTIEKDGKHTLRIHLRLDDALDLPSIKVSIPLREIYRKTELAA